MADRKTLTNADGKQSNISIYVFRYRKGCIVHKGNNYKAQNKQQADSTSDKREKQTAKPMYAQHVCK